MRDLNFNSEESEYLELILEELEGVITAENAIRLMEWRLLIANNDSFYQDIIKLQDDLELLQIYKDIKPEKSLDALYKKIDFNPISKTESKIKIRNIQFGHWVGIAASFLIISLVAFYFIRSNDIVSFKTAATEQQNFILPDGTKIFLNANSEVNYSKSNFQKFRKLELVKGECFLNVAHNPDRPFSVHYKDLAVTDIGTSFNVKEAQNQIDVSVNTGQVKLNVNGAEAETILNAGEAGYYQIVDKTVRKTKIKDPNYKAYTDRNIYFNNTSLPEVVKTLESVYHKKIVIQSFGLKTRKFTGEFRDQKLKDVLLVIAETLQINIGTNKLGVIYLTSKN